MCIKVQELLGAVLGEARNVVDMRRCEIGCALAGFNLFAIGEYLSPCWEGSGVAYGLMLSAAAGLGCTQVLKMLLESYLPPE